MLFVIPVAESGQIAIGASLPRILSRRLPIHLKNAAARSADHAPYKIDIVDLHGGSGGLVRLIDALKTRADQAFGSPIMRAASSICSAGDS